MLNGQKSCNQTRKCAALARENPSPGTNPKRKEELLNRTANLSFEFEVKTKKR